MFEWLWIPVAAGGLAVAFVVMGNKKLDKALEKARTTGEVAGVVTVIEAAPEKKHPNMWDQSISTLWQEYHRQAAIALMIAAARRSDAPVIQFWLKKAMEVEPQLAAEQFTEEFLEEFFKPAVAARCGRVSCCM